MVQQDRVRKGNSKLWQAGLNFVRRRRGERWFAVAASGCEKLLRAYYNEGNWDMASNGEMLLMRAYSDLAGGSLTVLDVGAHEGEWARCLLAMCPAARIVGFEILPPIREKLTREFSGDARVQIASCGLSDTSGTVMVTWNKSSDSTNAITPMLDGPFYRAAELESVMCEVRRGDEFLRENDLGPVGFLKIDTEGHDVNVLRGFSGLLSGKSAPRLIQFEYGSTYLAGRNRLRDAYDILEQAGYAIGRLYPKGVVFKPYELSDEHFRMGNHAAVKIGDPLVEKLQLPGRP